MARQETDGLRVPQHLLDSGVASEYAAQAVLAQCHHTKLHSLLFQGNRRRTLVDQLANWISNSQELINPLSPFVACVVTGITTFAVKELFFAYVLRAKSPSSASNVSLGL